MLVARVRRAEYAEVLPNSDAQECFVLLACE